MVTYLPTLMNIPLPIVCYMAFSVLVHTQHSPSSTSFIPTTSIWFGLNFSSFELLYEVALDFYMLDPPKEQWCLCNSDDILADISYQCWLPLNRHSKFIGSFRSHIVSHIAQHTALNSGSAEDSKTLSYFLLVQNISNPRVKQNPEVNLLSSGFPAQLESQYPVSFVPWPRSTPYKTISFQLHQEYVSHLAKKSSSDPL